mgnify:CR=1 FL=1
MESKIKQLARILNTSGDILLETGLDQKPPFENITTTLNCNDITSELNIDDDVKQLAKQYSLLSDTDRELIKKTINSLAEKIEKN